MSAVLYYGVEVPTCALRKRFSIPRYRPPPSGVGRVSRSFVASIRLAADPAPTMSACSAALVFSGRPTAPTTHRRPPRLAGQTTCLRGSCDFARAVRARTCRQPDRPRGRPVQVYGWKFLQELGLRKPAFLPDFGKVRTRWGGQLLLCAPCAAIPLSAGAPSTRASERPTNRVLRTAPFAAGLHDGV